MHRTISRVLTIVAIATAYARASDFKLISSSFLGGSGDDDRIVGGRIQSDGTIVLAANLAEQLYTNGLGNYLNLLDAQRALYVSQDELVRSERVVTLNLVALYKALGGGWETDKTQHLAAPGAGKAAAAQEQARFDEGFRGGER